MRHIGRALVAVMVAWQSTRAQSLRADQAAFRETYKALVETNTTLSTGSCTLAAERVAARLKAVGFASTQLTPFSAPTHPKEGGLVVVYPGTESTKKAILLLAHLDVVEAKADDWAKDPFTLIEGNGFFYGRGTSDDKAMAAIWVDTLVRFKQEGYRPKRTVKLALTCGEETTYAFNGAEWLAKNRRELIDAEFALNEGGGGRLTPEGTPEVLEWQVGEKATQNFKLETTNPGGHSSRPVKPNAIVQLAAAIGKLDAFEFPVHLNPVSTAYFTAQATRAGGEVGAAMVALLKNPTDEAADAIVSRDATHHSMLRTTCVATLLNAGHANNALPQRATANLNCRIAPGEKPEVVRSTLDRVIGDATVKVTLDPPIRPTPGSPPLDPRLFEPAAQLAAELFAGVPVIVSMSTGATDGIFLFEQGIPTYGVPGLLHEADYGGIHGVNEHMRARSLYQGRDFLYRLVKLYDTVK